MYCFGGVLKSSALIQPPPQGHAARGCWAVQRRRPYVCGGALGFAGLVERRSSRYVCATFRGPIRGLRVSLHAFA